MCKIILGHGFPDRFVIGFSDNHFEFISHHYDGYIPNDRYSRLHKLAIRDVLKDIDIKEHHKYQPFLENLNTSYLLKNAKKINEILKNNQLQAAILEDEEIREAFLLMDQSEWRKLFSRDQLFSLLQGIVRVSKGHDENLSKYVDIIFSEDQTPAYESFIKKIDLSFAILNAEKIKNALENKKLCDAVIEEKEIGEAFFGIDKELWLELIPSKELFPLLLMVQKETAENIAAVWSDKKALQEAIDVFLSDLMGGRFVDPGYPAGLIKRVISVVENINAILILIRDLILNRFDSLDEKFVRKFAEDYFPNDPLFKKVWLKERVNNLCEEKKPELCRLRSEIDKIETSYLTNKENVDKLEEAIKQNKLCDLILEENVIKEAFKNMYNAEHLWPSMVPLEQLFPLLLFIDKDNRISHLWKGRKLQQAVINFLQDYSSPKKWNEKNYPSPQLVKSFPNDQENRKRVVGEIVRLMTMYREQFDIPFVLQFIHDHHDPKESNRLCRSVFNPRSLNGQLQKDIKNKKYNQEEILRRHVEELEKYEDKRPAAYKQLMDVLGQSSDEKNHTKQRFSLDAFKRLFDDKTFRRNAGYDDFRKDGFWKIVEDINRDFDRRQEFFEKFEDASFLVAIVSDYKCFSALTSNELRGIYVMCRNEDKIDTHNNRILFLQLLKAYNRLANFKPVVMKHQDKQEVSLMLFEGVQPESVPQGFQRHQTNAKTSGIPILARLMEETEAALVLTVSMVIKMQPGIGILVELMFQKRKSQL